VTGCLRWDVAHLGHFASRDETPNKFILVSLTSAGLMTAESHLAIESSSYLLTYLAVLGLRSDVGVTFDTNKI